MYKVVGKMVSKDWVFLAEKLLPFQCVVMLLLRLFPLDVLSQMPQDVNAQVCIYSLKVWYEFAMYNPILVNLHCCQNLTFKE